MGSWLPTAPFLPEFGGNVCLSGELNAELYILPFPLFKAL